ncbi:hypothetical protein [Pontibacillus yanchengensis]|uniref:Uncharacterized protein n=1 Tax=Pontibacillus yanchengensis Y32 TaxID=1385514 RepID=A0A0A2TI65_9BACI|nr:hypothetical protein [Pontibacillus yanchengensis]KGP73756.1 hypothetical protein N782_02415 [Pontibacillus yanchengensis Y32]
MNRNNVILIILIVTAILISSILFLLNHPMFIAPILLLTLSIKSFGKPTEIKILSTFTFFLYPGIISSFLHVSLIMLFPSINEYLSLGIGGFINLIIIFIMYFYLESDYRRAYINSQSKLEGYSNFLERIRISVDIVRYCTGAILTLLVLVSTLITEDNVVVALELIKLTPSQLGVTPLEVINYLDFLIYSIFLPFVLGNFGVKIIADYAKFKKRPYFID